MRGRAALLVASVVSVTGLAAVLLCVPAGASRKAMLVFTQVPVAEDAGALSGDAWRFPPRSRIVALDPADPGGGVKILTETFHAARAPRISFDGKRLLFAGRRTDADPWQIWEMTLGNSHARRVTRELAACTDPAYLPGDRIVFSARSTGPSAGAGGGGEATSALYTCGLDGSGLDRIVHLPHHTFAPTVMKDGRVLFLGRGVHSSTNDSALLLARADGTGIELFYRSPDGGWPVGRGWETSDGSVVWVESAAGGSAPGRLVSVSTRRPWQSRTDIAAPAAGSFRSVYPLASGAYVVSHRADRISPYALYEFDPAAGGPGRLIHADPGFHALEPVMTVESPRPRKFESLVKKEMNNGWLFCLNATLSRSSTPGGNVWPPGGRVQVLGTSALLTELVPEPDGSFFVEVPADTPLRLQTVDDAGRIVVGPSGWIWVRPNERRGCIGCHEDPGLSPENRVPLAVTKPPVPMLKAVASGEWTSAGERRR